MYFNSPAALVNADISKMRCLPEIYTGIAKGKGPSCSFWHKDILHTISVNPLGEEN